MAGVGAGTATLIFLSLTPTLPSRFVANGLLAPLFCVLLIGVACLPESVDRLLVRARLTKLGDASLSVFILHMPFVVTFLALRHRGLLTDAVRMPLFAAFLVVMVASSAALESWFVQPMATRVKARLDRWLGPEVPLVLTPRRATPLEPFTGPSAARRGTRPAPRSTAA
jgi:peptidoglycan/LPS O-acetylase OafA/YrhL